ncbi:hypothetical protein ACHAWF_002870, partial [Thalassiosira exigua]
TVSNETHGLRVLNLEERPWPRSHRSNFARPPRGGGEPQKAVGLPPSPPDACDSPPLTNTPAQGQQISPSHPYLALLHRVRRSERQRVRLCLRTQAGGRRQEGILDRCLRQEDGPASECRHRRKSGPASSDRFEVPSHVRLCIRLQDLASPSAPRAEFLFLPKRASWRIGISQISTEQTAKPRAKRRRCKSRSRRASDDMADRLRRRPSRALPTSVLRLDDAGARSGAVIAPGQREQSNLPPEGGVVRPLEPFPPREGRDLRPLGKRLVAPRMIHPSRLVRREATSIPGREVVSPLLSRHPPNSRYSATSAAFRRVSSLMVSFWIASGIHSLA